LYSLAHQGAGARLTYRWGLLAPAPDYLTAAATPRFPPEARTAGSHFPICAHPEVKSSPRDASSWVGMRANSSPRDAGSWVGIAYLSQANTSGKWKANGKAAPRHFDRTEHGGKRIKGREIHLPIIGIPMPPKTSLNPPLIDT